jgi:fructokinase
MVVGEALVDVVRQGAATAEHVGGSPANVALGLARQGVDVLLATHIANDRLGVAIADALAGAGVRLTEGSRSAARTPTATATIDADGQAEYVFDVAWDLEDGLVAPQGGHLHVGSIGAILEPGASKVARLSERSRRDGATVSYDPNVRPGLMGDRALVRPAVERLVAAADVVKASADDAAWLYPGLASDQVLALWRGLGPALAVITDGAAGATVRLDGPTEHVPSPKVAVVDTVGAGDTFMAGLVAGLAEAGLIGGPDAGLRLKAATWRQIKPLVERAATAAAINCARAGADPPTSLEIDQALALQATS